MNTGAEATQLTCNGQEARSTNLPPTRTNDLELPDPILDALSELYWQERCPDL